MLEEPGWRTKYVSIYGESVRQEMLQRKLTVTYVSTSHQLADPLTKPTSALISQTIYPQWGLVIFLSTCSIFPLDCSPEGEHGWVLFLIVVLSAISMPRVQLGSKRIWPHGHRHFKRCVSASV